MKKIITGIYCIEDITNHKKYIGQSVDILDRWRRHISELNLGSHCNDYLQKSWNKNGQTNFKFTILEECDDVQLNDKERFYIEKYNTLDRNCGYNLKDGGQDCNRLTDQIKMKIKEAIKTSYDDPERRKIQKENALKQWANPEIKKKIMGENNGMYGRHHSEESKRKMSQKKKGTVSWRRNHTPVLCIELNRFFEDATEASKELSVDSGGILKVCRGQRHICGGYHWKFIIGE